MLFAAVNTNSPEYAFAVLLGSLIAGVICGLWPLCVGLSLNRPIMAVIGFFTCIPCGYLLGCLLALPVAFVFKLLIQAMGRPDPPSGNEFQDPPFNPYANGKRSAF
jgi:hypothetical protein